MSQSAEGIIEGRGAGGMVESGAGSSRHGHRNVQLPKKEFNNFPDPMRRPTALMYQMTFSEFSFVKLVKLSWLSQAG